MKILILAIVAIFLVGFASMKLAVAVKQTKAQYVEQKCADFERAEECKDVYK